MNFSHQLTNKKVISMVLVFVLLTILAVILFILLQPRTFTQKQNLPSGIYYISGNKILDAQGHEHIFQGVAKPSLEWSARGEHISEQELLALKQALPKANIIRLHLNQTFWLSKGTGKEYQRTVRRTVSFIENKLRMDVLIDLHSKGDNDISEDHHLPNGESVRFWDEAAREYKNEPHVLFELYNEPVLPKNASGDVWLKGGKLDDGFAAVGMQALVDVIRGTGAKNIIVVNGIDYGYNFVFTSQRIALPQGTNIVFGSHPYNYGGKNTPADWERDFMFLQKQYPIMLTEFGDTQNCDGKYDTKIIGYAKQQKISWIAWAWYPAEDDCKFPSLIDKNNQLTPAGKTVQGELQN